MQGMLKTIRARSELMDTLCAARRAGRRIGFVPTMGALHDGHLSLVQRACESCDLVVASIFVNPTQFAPGEDLDSYPRQEESDLLKLERGGCDIVYLPAMADMYPDGTRTQVRVEQMSDILEGVYRPHFFYGVTTVVARLFVHVAPDIAVFGEKDFQQLQILRRMVRDLGFAIEIIGVPTIRDTDGLALSSRNAYLTSEERALANTLSSALHRAAVRMASGVSVELCTSEAQQRILKSGFEKVDYVAVVDPESLAPVPNGALEPTQSAQILAAAWLGRTRLIDTLPVKVC